MNKFSIATVISLAMTAAAAAADLPAKAPSRPTAFSWTGFYAGVNAGYAWSSARDVLNYVAPPPGPGGSSNTSEYLPSYIVGGQLGYNLQMSRNWIVGVEADAQSGQAHQLSNSNVLVAGTPVPGMSTQVLDTLESFGTVRGRIGFAVARWMFYGTGGYAWQYLNSTVNGNYGAFPIMSNYGVQSGWAAGGGIEVAFTDKWSAKLEYLRIDSGTWNNTTGVLNATSPLVTGGFVGAGTTINESTRVKSDIVRIGLNYRFF